MITKPTLDLVTPFFDSPPAPHISSALFSPIDPHPHSNQALRPMVLAKDSQHRQFASIQPKPWDIKTGKTSARKPRGRKRGLEASERQRVAKNRGSACERHRKSRTKVYSTYKLSGLLINSATVSSKHVSRK